MLVQTKCVQAELATKFADFHIRVYVDNSGKEHLVLWTKDLDFAQPVLVRVHSECLTGDVIGSLHCDCGQQLNKSLRMIGEEEGVLIYLRQEGRGIGLFEKIKSYHLQSKGYDTIEANLLLGHRPDQRSYEIVKTMLQDLDISRIRLLTNNPSKVSEIAKLGVEVVERVPLISRANKFNKNYLETKKKKFQHFISQPNQYYLYQFQTDSIKGLDNISDFIDENKRDPLLKVAVGVSCNRHFFNRKAAMRKINEIFEFCSKKSNLLPILHFSFKNSPNILEDVYAIKDTWPLVKRLQLNDIKLDIDQLKKICRVFRVDIPLSDTNFQIVHDPQFRDLVKKNGAFIVLDNSKGKGKKESKESFISKIDVLLSYGLNNITLCGGFGPDKLETYFEIRRFYKVNFSVDAETHLKIGDNFDEEKIRLYLQQLIRFDDPKQLGVDQTKDFLKKSARSKWDTVEIHGSKFTIHPKVFHAGHFPSTQWFATQLTTLLKTDSSFCEIGCGSGVISCLTAISNPKLMVVATDINPYATENTKVNVDMLGLNDRIEIFNGDVLDSIDPSMRFNVIFWALPFGFLDPGASIGFEEAQVFDPGYRAIRKLLRTAQNYLTPEGRMYLGFSSDLGHYDLLQTLAEECGADLKVVVTTTIEEGVSLKFEILELSYGWTANKS